MNQIVQPMLASEIKKDKLDSLQYPLIASPKLDGIRCIVQDDTPLTRSLKPIPNHYLCMVLGSLGISGLDGELIAGLPTEENIFNKTTSAVMTQEGEPEIKFYVFDKFDIPSLPYKSRMSILNQRILELQDKNPLADSVLRVLEFQYISSSTELDSYEQRMVEAGYEGIMLRDPEGFYKYGRSSARQGLLMKLKRFKDDEAVIIGFEEKLHNANEPKINERGLQERSSHKANMVGAKTLGAVVVESSKYGVFRIGSGFNDALRRHIWDNKLEFLGQTCVYKFQVSGVLDKPRFPTWKGLRSKLDVAGGSGKE